MSNLKPCPFCGGEAELKGGGLSQETVSVWCANGHKLSGGSSDWNTRTPDPAAIWQEAMEKAARTAGYSGAIQDPRDGSYAGSEPVMGPDVAEEIRNIPNPYEANQ